MTASAMPLAERLRALKDWMPKPHGGRVDAAVDALALLDECAIALERGAADTQRLDKLTSDPSCLRSIGRACYWDAPNGYRRLSGPRQVLDAAILWDAERVSEAGSAAL